MNYSILDVNICLTLKKTFLFPPLFLCFVTRNFSLNFFSPKNYYFCVSKTHFGNLFTPTEKKNNFHNFLSELGNSHSKIIVIVLMMWRDFFVYNRLRLLCVNSAKKIVYLSFYARVWSRCNYYFFGDLSQHINPRVLWHINVSHLLLQKLSFIVIPKLYT